MKRFIPTDIEAVRILERMSFRINEIFLALKELGNFDNEIKVSHIEKDYFNRGLTTVDNVGDRYTFEGYSLGKIDEIMCEKADGIIIIIYRLLVGLNKSDIKIAEKSIIEKLRNDYDYESSLNITNGHPIIRSIKRGNSKFIFATSSLYNFDENLFKSQVEYSQSVSFMEFVELVHNNLHSLDNNIDFITFTAQKGTKEIGRIIIEKGNVTRFSLVEEQENQILTIELRNGVLVEKSTITIDTVISSLPQPLIGTIEKARRLVKGQ